MDEGHITTGDGIRIHYRRQGSGTPLILLHGWPEFSLTWEPVMTRLADRFDLIAPDLRGFGDSDKPDPRPSDMAGAGVHAGDVIALADALGLGEFGIVSHDVGAYVAQSLGHSHPERLSGLFFFNCPYPGLGPRFAAPDRLKEIWYQAFNQKPFAAAMVGSSREACAHYIGHFLRHWAGGNPNAFDDVFDAFIDNFMKPGNLQGGFNWYISQNAGRLKMLKGEAPAPEPIEVPTCIRWPEHDPLFPPDYTDQLPAYFTDLDLAIMHGVGHFAHREAPDHAAQEIASFFEQRGASGR